jgi:hypothetical protein
LLDYLVRDASFSPIEDLDRAVAELRQVLAAATEIPETITIDPLKRAA